MGIKQGFAMSSAYMSPNAGGGGGGGCWVSANECNLNTVRNKIFGPCLQFL